MEVSDYYNSSHVLKIICFTIKILRSYMSILLLERTLKQLPKVRGIRSRQKPQAPTPQAPVRNRQTRKVANAKVRIC